MYGADPLGKPDLKVDFAGIQLANPVVLLSGCVGFGEDLARLEGFDFGDVGAICLKGTTLTARQGNPPPRVVETASGMLNAIGLQNPGARHVVDEILPRIGNWPTKLIANIAGSNVEEYGEVARIFDNSPVAGIEINISCPNVKEGGAAFGSDPLVAARVVDAVRKGTSKPIITKLSPNVTDIRTVAKAVIDSGTDGLSAINTLMGMAVDIVSGEAVLGNFQGGLSGAAIKPVALLQVWRVYEVAQPHGIPIMGQGGIETGSDAVEFILAGSSAVGVGTSLFKNPLNGGDVAVGVGEYLAESGHDSVASLVGTLKARSR
ncbi:MAG: dihydroorotate dehydrogenase [Magnetococcales bacterium]|nr:dihydroorotate dehydrogenase [Magnetococcales bacterium]